MWSSKDGSCIVESLPISNLFLWQAPYLLVSLTHSFKFHTFILLLVDSRKLCKYYASVGGTLPIFFFFLGKTYSSFRGLPRWFKGKESAFQCRKCRGCGFNPWLRKIPWKRKWQPTPISLTGKCRGQRNLESYSPWGCKESDMT